MPILPDIKSNATSDEPQAQIDSLVRQVNEWGRQISNESRTLIINDDSGVPIILIGYGEGLF